MSQFATAKNPPWVRAQTGLVPPPGQPGPPLLAAQQAAPVAVVAAAAQNPPPQQGPAVSASFGTGLAALTLTQSALQQGAMLQQGLAIPASLATTQVANVNSGMVVEISRLPQPGVALPTSLATSQVAAVSYPAPRLLAQAAPYQPPAHQAAAAAVAAAAQQQAAAAQQAAVAAVAAAQQQQQQTAQQQAAAAAAAQPQYKHRVFTGVVTKLHENFGFIDEDVFFQTSSVKGNMPKTSERVLAEATYNPSMPFKWTATRIQVLPNQVVQVNVPQPANGRPQLMQQQQQRTQPLGLPSPQGVGLSLPAAQGAFPGPGGRWPLQQEQLSLMESSLIVAGQQQQQRLNMAQNNQHSWMQEVDYGEAMDGKMGGRLGGGRRQQHSPPRREARRERYRERYSPPPARKRSRSPRSPPPARRRLAPRVIPRYTVQIPKISLDLKVGNVMELRRRYANLYMPSDFCAASFLWQEAFPPHRPFSMDHPCTFHIVGKDAVPPDPPEGADAPPPEVTDADYSYSAKVMLMSCPSLGEIYRRSCALAEEGGGSGSASEEGGFVHPTRLVSFLVGLRGKSETVAIGGPWSPSLDGPDPRGDPGTLVRTAIRTCRALTGVDLSKCVHWYRFAEIHYRRGESSSSKGRVETVVLFVPDVWSCLPTRIEWEGTLAASTLKKSQWRLDAADVQAQMGDVKRQLKARNLSVKGLKSQLILRLTRALGSEKEAAGQSPDDEGADEDDDKRKKKEEERREKKETERRGPSSLPESPAVVVRPSRTAKHGKFDCAVMSLSLLLDYRQEDNKEHSFEVSLFAELFNEMLMRDFGFRIYRALVEAPEAKDDDKDKRKSEKKDDKRDRKDEKDDSCRKEDRNDVDSDKEDDESEDDDCDGDEKRDKERSKRRRTERRRRRPRMLTHDPHLLLSFAYFDQTHCGYLLEKDVEDLFHTLGLLLTRAQVRKLIQKVGRREVLRYRRLTDGPADAERPAAARIPPDLESLSSGNKKYLPEYAPPSTPVGGPSEGVVPHGGGLVDVGKLLERLEHRERALREADDRIQSYLLELEHLHDEAGAGEKLRQRLGAELEAQGRKLRAAEDELRRARQEADRCLRALGGVREGLQAALAVADGALPPREPSGGGGGSPPRPKEAALSETAADDAGRPEEPAAEPQVEAEKPADAESSGAADADQE